MTTVHHGSWEVELEPKLEEALTKFPFIGPAHQVFFRDYFAEHWAGGDVPRTLRKLALPPDFFCNLDRHTERVALELICMHATAAIFRECSYRQLPGLRRAGYTNAVISVAPNGSCAVARRKDGKTVSLNKVPVFPLQGCRSDVCFCGWRAERQSR